MKKAVKWTLTIVVILGIIVYGIAASLKPLSAEVIDIKSGTVAQEFKEEGIVSPVDEYSVYSLTNGELLQINAKEGQNVKKGDLLAVINTKELEYQLNQLKAQKLSLTGQEKTSNSEIGQKLEGLKGQLKDLKGQLESLEGQEIQAYKDPYSAQIKQQMIVIEETNRQLQYNTKEYSRLKQLYDLGAVSKKEMDDAQNKISELQSTLQQQEQALALIKEQAGPVNGTAQYYSGLKNSVKAQIETVEYQLSFSGQQTTGSRENYQGLLNDIDAQIDKLNDQISNGKVFAPIDGIVKEQNVKKGKVISTEEPLLSLMSTGNYKIDAYLLTEDVVGVKPGTKVRLVQKLRTGDVDYEGTVTEIAPAAVEKVSALGLKEQRIKVTVQPDVEITEIRPGYALDVKFTVFKQDNKLAVPKTTLFPYENGDALWVIRDHKATIQKVTKGLKTDELVVIEEGLKAGDVVVKNPQLDGLEEGKKVTAEKKK